MSDLIYDNIADFYKLFGDPTRIRILYTLLENELCVGCLATALGMTQSAVSHQLKILRQGSLVKCRKDGKNTIYSLDDSHVVTLLRQGLEHVKHRRQVYGGNGL